MDFFTRFSESMILNLTKMTDLIEKILQIRCPVCNLVIKKQTGICPICDNNSLNLVLMNLNIYKESNY